MNHTLLHHYSLRVGYSSRCADRDSFGIKFSTGFIGAFRFAQGQTYTTFMGRGNSIYL